LRPVLAPIAAAAGRDCGHRIAARKTRMHNRKSGCGSLATRSPRDSHTDAALARTPSLFRFASVASRPRFSHDPVNLAPDYDG
jgi:hypothetical protein